MPQKVWSSEQEAVFAWFAGGQGSLLVEAGPGTGKTTVIVEGVLRAPERSVIVAAFSRDIALELTKRLAGVAGRKSYTLHSIGFRCALAYRDRLRLDPGPGEMGRAERLAVDACGRNAPDDAVKAVMKLLNKAREVAPHAAVWEDLADLAIEHECLVQGDLADDFDLRWVCERALSAMDAAANVQAGDLIDYSDMVFLPVRNRWFVKMADLVVVDEGQDMTPAQLEIAVGVLRPGGRLCIVGDRHQAIFQFRGIKGDTLLGLAASVNAARLTLTTTYRCGRRIVAEANTIVRDYHAGEGNPEGEVVAAKGLHHIVAMAGPGDFVLSRTNAPLVSVAVKLLRAGKRARIAGKDVGKGLTALVRRLRPRSADDLVAKLQRWADLETAKLTAERAEAKTMARKATIDAKLEEVADRAGMVRELCENAETVDDVLGKLEALFQGDKAERFAGTIVCSSVHKAKGLEAERVFALRDTFRSGSEEEDNIRYVAITRAKHTLVWVDKAEE